MIYLSSQLNFISNKHPHSYLFQDMGWITAQGCHRWHDGNSREGSKYLTPLVCLNRGRRALQFSQQPFPAEKNRVVWFQAKLLINGYGVRRPGIAIRSF